jgi:hypothetical protein
MTSAAVAASAPTGTGLTELGVSAGRWVYHGHFLAGKAARPSSWTWHEDCRWSANRAFMLCSFSNDWAGRHVNSVVVDTYDRKTHTFWHYEIFDSGRSVGKPFAARMQINGATRIESWTDTHHGKSVHHRIVYRFTSVNKVTVRFESSKNGTHWRTTANGRGEKNSDLERPGAAVAEVALTMA